MARLMKALLIAAGAAGAAYLALRVTPAPDSAIARKRRDPLMDADELSEAEKRQLLRELSAFL